MLIDLLAIGSSGFNLQNSFLKPLNQHELSIFWGGQFAPVYPGQFAPKLGGQFQPGKVVSLLRNMWSVYSVFSTLSTIVVNLGIYEGTQYQYMNLVENGSVINGENFYATLTSENDALVTKYLDSEGSELARFTVVNGILTAAVIHEQIQMKPGNFGSRWVACVTKVGMHFTDGTFSGAASGLFCMAWGGYCAAAITVLCAGTAYYQLQI